MAIVRDEITQLLADFRNGDHEAATRVMEIVYNELRQIARRYMQDERADHTLQPTALVHEVYIRLFGENVIEYQNCGHFFVVVSKTMRRLLVDHARRRHADRRLGDRIKLPLDEIADLPLEIDDGLVALDDVLSDLERLDPHMSQIVELRFFGGLTIKEVAESLKISEATVKRDWEYAKVWLYHQLSSK
jgi:RNA polymerase sigma factor (TIGR02999 family)